MFHKTDYVFVDSKKLNQKLFDVLLDSLDVALQLGSVLNSDRNRDDWSTDAGSSAEGLLGSNKNVWNVLIFAQERQMEKDLQWLGIGGHNNELGNTSVEAFGGFVGALSELLVVGGLLDQIEDLLGQAGVGEWVGLWVYVSLISHFLSGVG